MPSYEQDEQALQHFNQFKRKISQNRLLIISAVNLLTFALSIFSITYYKWVWVEIISLDSQKIEQQGEGPNQLWVNLLYGKQLAKDGYNTFENIKVDLCGESDAKCQALFIQFRFVGKCFLIKGILSFFMFVVAYILQIRDFYQFAYYLRASHVHSRQSVRYKSSLQAKDSFMHIVTILSYSIGLGLNFFSLTLMDLNDYQYGVSFWTFFSSLIVFIICIIYKNISISRIAQRSLMLNLIEEEKNLRKQELVENSKSESQSSDFEI